MLLPPPRLVTARGALRRSLLIWGWGQLATGDRRGWLLAGLEAVSLIALVLVGWPAASGSSSDVVFLAGGLFVAAWAAVAIHAYRRAARRRAIFDLVAADGGAVDLLWLSPILIVASTLFWIVGGSGSSADSTTSRYAAAWRHDQAASAGTLFAMPPTVASVHAAWARQDVRLHDELARLSASLGPDAGIDPNAPFDSLRFEPVSDNAPQGSAGDSVTAADTAVTISVQVVRLETVQDRFLGLFPTSAVRIVPVEELGTIRLRPVPLPGAYGGAPTTIGWRIEALNLLGEQLGE
jgi:hypothetical protein